MRCSTIISLISFLAAFCASITVFILGLIEVIALPLIAILSMLLLAIIMAACFVVLLVQTAISQDVCRRSDNDLNNKNDDPELAHVQQNNDAVSTAGLGLTITMFGN